MSDSPSSLIDLAYAAALDDSLWPDWVERMMTAMGAGGATFVVLDATSGEIRQLLPIWGPSRIEEEYRAHFGQFDPQVSLVTQIDRPVIYASEEYLDERVPATAAYMTWQRASAGMDHHLTAAVPLGDGGLRAALSNHGRVGTGPLSVTAKEMLRRIFPDLVRAWQLGFELHELLTDRLWEGLASRAERTAALLLDERGRMVRASEAALSIMAAGDGLSLQQGILRAAIPADDTRLASLVGRAVCVDSPESGALRINRPSGRRPLVVIGYPLVRQRRYLAPFEAAALVRILDPTRHASQANPSLLSAALDLTRRETQLATLPVANHSVESAAATLGIAVPTARLHLHHLFAKTGSARQPELVSLLRTVGSNHII